MPLTGAIRHYLDDPRVRSRTYEIVSGAYGEGAAYGLCPECNIRTNRVELDNPDVELGGDLALVYYHQVRRHGLILHRLPIILPDDMREEIRDLERRQSQWERMQRLAEASSLASNARETLPERIQRLEMERQERRTRIRERLREHLDRASLPPPVESVPIPSPAANRPTSGRGQKKEPEPAPIPQTVALGKRKIRPTE